MGPLALVVMFVGVPSLPFDTGSSLTTLAAATNRPAECAVLTPRSGTRKASVWRLARLPTLGAFCDDVARAHALLGSDPKSALAAATEADSVLPNRASASVAIGRAKLALGDARGALEAFDRALELDKRSVDEPKAMNDHARALVLAGKGSEAASLYRALVPRAELLPDSARPLVYLQAAHALMAHAASVAGKEPGKPSKDAALDLADAAAYLVEARTSQSSAMRGDVLVSLALVFDRSGDSDKTAAALGEAQRSGASLSDAGQAYVATPNDALALAALVAETQSAAGAAGEWTKFVDAAPSGPWAASAKGRIALLKRSGKGGEAPKPAKKVR